MAILQFRNDAQSTIAGSINATATLLQLAAGTGALFPSPGANRIFVGTLVNAATGQQKEIVTVTARTGDQLTIVRGQEGTAPQSWNAGDIFGNFWTAGQAAAMLQQQQLNSPRIITTSGAFVMTSADGIISLRRTTGVAASSTTLPVDPFLGQQFTIQDVVGNFNGSPCTVAAPVGTTIAGLASVVLNVNRQSAVFNWCGDGIWGVKL